MNVNLDTLLSWETRYRAAFINALGGFKSVVLVGTANGLGQTNLAIFNSLFHLGANPPLCGLIVRPDSVERHTLHNCLETGQYTLNHIQESFYEQAHQTSARYAQDESEFDAVGLTPYYHNGFKAPAVKESAVQMGLELKEKLDLAINGTVLLIGQIQWVNLPDACVGEDGFIDLERAGTITCSGLDSYHTTKKLGRLSYAKPDKALVKF